MSRAAPLPPDLRRQAIKDATRPLLIAHGPGGVSTRQIAEAAGVAEGTIFRAFESKSALINEVITDILAPDRKIAAIRELPSGQPLDDRVTDILELLQRHFAEVRSVVSAWTQPPDRDCGPKAAARRLEGRAATLSAVADSLRPYADALRTDPATAANALLAIAFATAHPFTTDSNPVAPPATLASLILHGIAKDQ